MHKYMRLLSVMLADILLQTSAIEVAAAEGNVAHIEFVESGGYVLHYLGLHELVRVKVTDDQQKPVPFVTVIFFSDDRELADFLFHTAVTDTNGVAATLIKSQISDQTILNPPPEFLERVPLISALAQNVGSPQVPVRFLWRVFVDPEYLGPYFGFGMNSFIDISNKAGESFTLTGNLYRALGDLPASGTRFATFSTDSRIVQADSAVSDSDRVQITMHSHVPGIAHIIVTGTPPAAISVLVQAATAVLEEKQDEDLPLVFALWPNYPNPLRDVGELSYGTTIKYQLPQPNKVSLKVFDLLGHEVKTVVNREHLAGQYSIFWDGRNSLGNQVASGIYVYRLETGRWSASKTMLIIR